MNKIDQKKAVRPKKNIRIYEIKNTGEPLIDKNPLMIKIKIGSLSKLNEKYPNN